MNDRGMKKWMPFNSLTGHFEKIDSVIKRKEHIQMPEVDKEYIEKNLAYAITNNEIVNIKIYNSGVIEEIKNVKILNIKNGTIKLDNLDTIDLNKLVDIFLI